MLVDVGVTGFDGASRAVGMGECACESPESREVESFGLAFESPHLHSRTLCATVAIVWCVLKPRRYVIARYEIESWERSE